MESQGRSTTLALLGPTNTGKTHHAIERMLEHPTGMIGLPLRLLAREVYDRVTARIGEREVALVTGEEKRVPPRPRYWICTVEAMPVELEVDFLAVDEVQLASHAQRGHVFTERLQGARGRRETWFLGSLSAEWLVKNLVPTVRVKSNPRLSSLRAAGQSTLALLPERSALVAFSANRVYELAERVRQKHGGAAVVLGALSPRARNAQVALYQAGEVDYLVATDAIGMGLNLDIHHVAFADLQKFDGREMRLLEPAELGQIAGRAGRYLNDGTFGTLAPLSPMPEALARSIETHAFPNQQSAWWRNDRLDFSSIEALVASLSERPRTRYLKLVERAEDFEALCQLIKRDEVRSKTRSPEAVELLWQVCRIPDYRGLLLEYHASLLSELFLQLSGRTGRIETDFAAERIRRLNDTEGDIETLLARMAFIRTWTYISHQSSWLADAGAWQDETRAIEDRLSDALHERLVQKFVDRGAKRRARPGPRPARRSEHRPLEAAPLPDNPFQRLSALRDELLRKDSAPFAAGEADARVNELVNSAHEQFRVDERGRIFAAHELVAKMTRGPDLLHPEVTVLLPELGAGARLRIQRRMVAFTRDLSSELLSPLRESALAALSAAGRGLVYQLERGLGTIWTHEAAPQLAALSAVDRALLERAGVRFGNTVVYLPALLAPQALVQRSALWCAFTGEARALTGCPPSFPVDARLSRAGHSALGYPIFGKLALRADVVARVQAVLRRAARRGPFRPPPVLQKKLGCLPEALPSLVRAFGYVPARGGRFVRERGTPLLVAAGNKP